MSTLVAALRSPLTQTVGLLAVSNVFMTFAWYGHLRKHTATPVFLVILASWGIAFLEYCFQVPANRIGYLNNIPLVQLKTIQEIITLVVFAGFAFLFMDQRLRWNHLVGFALIVAAVFFMFMSFEEPKQAA